MCRKRIHLPSSGGNRDGCHARKGTLPASPTCRRHRETEPLNAPPFAGLSLRLPLGPKSCDGLPLSVPGGGHDLRTSAHRHDPDRGSEGCPGKCRTRLKAPRLRRLRPPRHPTGGTAATSRSDRAGAGRGWMPRPNVGVWGINGPAPKRSASRSPRSCSSAPCSCGSFVEHGPITTSATPVSRFRRTRSHGRSGCLAAADDF
jgi:hypothetical protein